MDTHAATAGLVAVHHEVVGVRAHSKRVAVEKINLVLVGLGEGLVLGVQALAVLVPVEQREVHNPEEVVALARHLELVCHVAAHATQDLVGVQAALNGKHHKVAGLDVHLGAKRGHLLVREELDDGAGHRAVLAEGDVRQTLGAKLGGDVGQAVDARAGPLAGALGVDGLDVLALGCSGGSEELELGCREDRRHVVELHAVAGVGLVGAVGVHGVPVLDAAERQLKLHAHLAKGLGKHVLERVHNVVLGNEAHLDVHLGELGLAVLAQVFVAEALCHLVVALDATHHEELLQELRGLRQRVEVTRLHAAGNQEVTGALGRGLEERGGLDLHEVGAVEGLAQGKGEVAAKLEVGHHLGTTQVEVTVAQAHVLGGVNVVLDLERGRLGRVEHHDLGHVDLNGARGQLVVVLALGTLAHGAAHHDGPLGTDGLGLVEGGFVADLGVKLELGHASAIAKVDKDQATVVAAVPHPAGERDLLADVRLAQLAAGVRVHAIGHMVPLASSAPCRAGGPTDDGAPT